MRVWAIGFTCILVLCGAAPSYGQQRTGPRTLEGLLNSDEPQKPNDAEAKTPASPKRPAGTVARPKDGVQHPDLDKAWADYDAAVMKAADGIRAAINKQFDAAAAKGDLDAAEEWQNALEKFEKAGEVPTEKEAKMAVSAAVSAYKKAREELTKAYEALVKNLTMEKKITEAKKIRGELVGVTSPKPSTVSEDEETARVSSESGSAQPQREGAVFGGHRYKFVSGPCSWAEANERCKRMGGRLVSIESKKESDFLLEKVIPRQMFRGEDNVWLGASDADAEGDWRWVTGNNLRFALWKTGEPNNVEGKEHYAVVRPFEGEWYDVGTTNSNNVGFVCEWIE